jgi:PAS domain S-box-containing protein
MNISNEKFLRKLLGASINGIYIYDLRLGRNVYVNDQYTRITGYELEDINAMSGLRFFELFHPEDRPRVSEHFENISRGVETTEIEYRFKIKEGGWIWCLSRDQIFDRSEDGSVRQFIGSFIEITKLKKTEDALRKSEALYRAVAENFPEGAIYVFDHDLRFRVADGMAMESLGFTREGLEGKTIREAFDEQNCSILEKRYPRVLAGESLHYETELKGRVFSSEYVPIRDENGNVTAGMVVSTDITDRKKAEESLAASERKYRELVETANSIILRCDKQGEIRFVNDYGARALGYEPDELVGTRAIMLIPDLESTGRDLSKLLRDILENPDRYVNYWNENVRKDGAKIWVVWTNKAIADENGKVREVLSIGNDITALKNAEEAVRKSEERLRALVAASSEVLYTMSPDWSEMRRLEGGGFLADTESPNRYWLEEYIHPDDRPQVMSAINEAVEKKRVFQLEHRIQREDGSWGWILSRAVPVLDSKGEIAEWFGAASDFTERKRAEDELRRMNENLERLVSERTRLAEDRAKKLQALTVELLEAEELERHRIAELLHDDLQQMLAAALFQLKAANVNLQNEPTLEFVKEILVESIEKSRKLSHELSPPVLYYGSLYSALEWLGCQMNDQFGLKVELQDGKVPNLENTPLKVFLFRAVQELLFNIVKHAGVNSAHVVISGSNGNVTVTVTDQGKGFNNDIIDSSGGEKTGFGLISISERAQRIGGYLKIKSEPGQGSTLILVTPVQTADRQEPLKTGEPIDSAEQETVSVDTRLRVLIVDDHEVMRQGLVRLISSQPRIQVVGEAANGKEAVELARQLHPDVIVMDISMPEMDGIEATQRIKSEFPDLRIVGLSMFEDDQSVKSIINAGADAFVPKTASSAKVLKAIYGNGE